ncbi:MAG: protein kinase [Anaerolineae bacterium]|nr:protein kinase [Anaerolineae bacterium]
MNKRYVVKEQLGQGGMGVVLKAYDRVTGQTVALKRVTAAPDQLTFTTRAMDGTLSFKVALAQEFHTLASLRHPNIISVLDYGFDEQQMPYFTMDLLENAAPIDECGKGASPTEQAQLIVQLLQALVYLHRRGIVHRDLKPANVLVKDRSVKVLDFGLAINYTQDDASEEDDDDDISGTLAYMAPEVLRGNPARAASDLYTVGVIAYELATGQSPFVSSNMSLLLSNIINKEPALEVLGTDSPLLSIIERLLMKNPQERYANAADVIEAYQKAYGQQFGGDTAVLRESFLEAARFIGREKELKQLTDALNQALEGTGSSWLIGGESGVGKSRLLDELRALALVRGGLVLRGYVPSEGGAPYEMFRGPMRSLALEIPLEPEEASILKLLVPDIGRLLEYDVPDAPPLEPQAALNRLLATVEAVFRRSTRPLVLLLEDLHWASESLILLSHLNRIAPDLKLLILGTYSDDENPNMPAQLPEMALLKLKRLSQDAIAELSASILGETIGRQPEIVDLLRRETEGNILFIVEVLRVLAEEAGNLRYIGRVSLPQSVFAQGIKTIVQRRLNRVSPASYEMLKRAAVAGRVLDLKIVPVDDKTLLECSEAAVLVVDDNRWHFTHEKLRQALLDDLQPEEQSTLHIQVAEAIENAYGDAPEQAPALAYHWGQGQVVDKALHYYSQTITHYTSIGLPRQATEYGRAALRLLGVDLPVPVPEIGAAIGAEMGAIMQTLAGRSPAELLNLPPLHDPQASATIGLLLQLQPATQISGQPELFALISLKAMNLTLQHGNAPFSPIVYAVFAALYRGMTGDSKTAYAFSEMAQTLDEHMGKFVTAPIKFLHTWFINHWVNPLSTSLQYNLDCAQAGLEKNDFLYSFFNLAAYVRYLQRSGAPLTDVIAVGEKHGAMINKGVAVAAFHCLHETQMAKALAGLTISPTSFTDAAVDEERDIASICQTENYNQIAYYLISKVRLHYLFGEDDKALEYAQQSLPILAAFQGQAAEFDIVLYYALALLSTYERTGDTELLATARTQLEKLQAWSALCEGNFQHKALLVQAELAGIEGESGSEALYNAAAAAAEKHGFTQYVALAYELAAARSKNPAYREQAAAAYQQWGAYAKLTHLRG